MHTEENVKWNSFPGVFFLKSDLLASLLQPTRWARNDIRIDIRISPHPCPLQVPLLLSSRRGGKGRDRRGPDDGLEGRASLGFKLEILQEAKGSWLPEPGLCWAVPLATLSTQQAAVTISMLMASRWQESNQHTMHSAQVSPRDLMPISPARGPNS